jgi:hypothetical protein
MVLYLSYIRFFDLMVVTPSCKILRDATPQSFVILDGRYFLSSKLTVSHAKAI